MPARGTSPREEKVTVVVPVLNDAENLDHCLTALERARKRIPVEVLVVDDGSSDSTGDVIRRHGVRSIRNERNRGQSWARNAGAREAQGEHVLFVDSDVVLSEDFFDAIEAFLRSPKPKGVVGLQGIFSLRHPHREWSSLIYNTIQNLVQQGPLHSPSVNTSALLLRRDAFLEAGEFREDLWYLEDVEFARRLAARGYAVQRGPAEFVHRKKVGWRWLFGTFFFGGRVQRQIGRAGGGRGGVGRQGAAKSRGSPIFLNSLLAGAAAIGAVTLCLAGDRALVPGLLLAALAVVLLSPCWRRLARARGNPLFVLAGTLFLLVAPWLLLLGFATGGAGGSHPGERRFWMEGRSPAREGALGEGR